MTRWFILFACAFAFTAAAPMGFEAHAKRAKTCKATMMDGKQTKWRCKAGTKCCYNWLQGKGACIGANDICL